MSACGRGRQTGHGRGWPAEGIILKIRMCELRNGLEKWVGHTVTMVGHGAGRAVVRGYVTSEAGHPWWVAGIGSCAAMGWGQGKWARGALAAPCVVKDPERPPYKTRDERPLIKSQRKSSCAPVIWSPKTGRRDPECQCPKPCWRRNM